MDERERPVATGGCCSSPAPSLVAAVIIIVVGAVLFLDRMGLADVGELLRYWPVLLILLGAANLLRPEQSSRVGGTGLVIFGGLFLLHNLGYLRVDWSTIWPLFIVGVGVLLLIRALEGRKQTQTPVGSAHSRLNEWVIFGGNKIRNDSKEFRGGELLAVFGGHEVDLTKAEMAEEEVALTATAIFGGVELRVPEHWRVVPKVMPILGGFDDKTYYRKPDTAQEKRLIVKGMALFGGVEIKN